MLRKYALIMALGYTAILTTLSLIRLNNMPDVGISFGDKLFHFGAYAVMTLVWFNYLITKKTVTKTRSILIAVIIAALFGTIIEALQGSLTTSRQADINDIIANNVGVLVAALFLWFLPKEGVKKY